MSSENGGRDYEAIAERIIQFAREGFEVEDANDAATVLGLPVHATEDEIAFAYQELVFLTHPDQSPLIEEHGRDLVASSFRLVKKAEDFLSTYDVEDVAEDQAQEARRQQAPESPGTGGWGPFAEESQEQYRQSYERVKVYYAEEFLGRTINAETIEEARSKGTMTSEDIDTINRTLREQFGVPDLTLDDIARVIASLIVSGAINLGNVERMAERSSVFGGQGQSVFGRGENEVFDRSGRRGGDSVFRR